MNWLLPSRKSPLSLCDTNINSEKGVRMGEWTPPVLCCKMKILHTLNSVNCKATWSIIHFFDTSTSPKRFCPAPLVSSWASVHLLLLHPLSRFSTYDQLFPFQEVVSQGKQRAWLTNSLSTMKNLADSNLILTHSKYFLSKALIAF